MTKSAKQGTEKAPAESAATESAATTAASTAAPGGQRGAEAAATPEPGGPAGAAGPAEPHGHDEHDADSVATGIDETKRKFREALERKNQAHSEAQGKGGKDSGKISGAHGPAASRRNFRRKSG